MIGRLRIALAILFAALILAVCSSALLFADDAGKPHVVFVTGDCEYRSEVSMPMIANILEGRHGMRCTVLYAVNTETGKRQPNHYGNIPGLEALETADLAVIFIRFRTLPEDQFQMLMRYVNSGRPLIGLRTTTHAFRYPSDHERAEWNDAFGIKVFGQKWITHHGHDSTTEVSIVDDQADHPILRGVDKTFPCDSWLYHVAPLVGDCRPLLTGQSINSNKSQEQRERFPLVQPVAWTKSHHDARVFFTTLGHPGDFEQESMRRLLINAVYWCLGNEVPEGGANADLVGKYVAPPTT